MAKTDFSAKKTAKSSYKPQTAIGAKVAGQNTTEKSESKEQPKKQNKGGRPKIYHEDLERFSVNIPASSVQKLKDLADFESLSIPQELTKIIDSIYQNKAEDIEKYKALRG